MIQFRILEILLLAVCVWRWKADHFAALNAFADSVENHLPRPLAWLGWKKGGNPVSWLQHALWTVGAGLVGGVLAWSFSAGFWVGLSEFATVVALCFYVPREGWQAVQHYRDVGWTGAWWIGRTHPFTGWVWDGVGDTLGPVLVVWAAWWLR